MRVSREGITNNNSTNQTTMETYNSSIHS